MERNLDSENNIIKNIAGEIVRKCAHKGIIVTHCLADYVVRLKLLNPNNGFTVAYIMERTLTQKLVAECVDELLEDSCAMDCIRLQVIWMKSSMGRDKVKQKYHEAVLDKSRPVMKEIIDITSNTKDDLDRLYKKIVVFTIMYSGLGNPTALSVLREANPALHSIFKSSQLETFLTMSRKEKEEHLVELTQIVTGIRLFNKDSQKGGDSIDDLPVLLVQAVAATKDRLGANLEALQSRIAQLTTSLESVYRLKQHRASDSDLESPLILPQDEQQEATAAKTLLNTLRQHEKYVLNLQHEVEMCSSVVVKVVEQLQKTLLQLHEAVRYRSAIPTMQVYPLFIELSFIWRDLQDEAVILSHINTTALQMTTINKYLQSACLVKAVEGSGSIPADEDAQLINNMEPIILPDSAAPGISLLEPTEVDARVLDLELDGMCAWCISQADGLLIPGNLDIGVVQYQSKQYVFRDSQAAAQWCRSPDRHILRTYNRARCSPELVRLLGLYEQLDHVKTEVLMMDESRQGVIKTSRETQTMLHPVPSHIDRHYTFSEWQLKRRAMQLANLVKCRTKSVQTVNCSQYRAHVGLQVNPNKNQGNQTMCEDTCNHPTVLNYMRGLRERPDDTPHVVTLTRLVDDQ